MVLLLFNFPVSLSFFIFLIQSASIDFSDSIRHFSLWICDFFNSYFCTITSSLPLIILSKFQKYHSCSLVMMEVKLFGFIWIPESTGSLESLSSSISTSLSYLFSNGISIKVSSTTSAQISFFLLVF